MLSALLPLCAASAERAEEACAGDIQIFCAGIEHGDGRVARCLRANQQKLSASCQSAMRAVAGLIKEVVLACEDDVHRYCVGAAPGTTKECLRTNFGELSFGCKRELFKAKEAM
jgi:hypothetical protein